MQEISTYLNQLLHVLFGESPLHVKLIPWVQHCSLHLWQAQGAGTGEGGTYLFYSTNGWSAPLTFRSAYAYHERGQSLGHCLAVGAALESDLADDVSNHAFCLRSHLLCVMCFDNTVEDVLLTQQTLLLARFYGNCV